MPTIHDLLQQARSALLPCSSTPELDAEVLLRHVLSVDPAWLIGHAGDEPGVEKQADFSQLLARRLRGEPVAYLLGQREFWSMELNVTPDVLIPRPETETLVELALKLLPSSRACRVVDLGTGSGAIALAIATERPQWRVTATDRSPAALDVARENSRRLGITDIEFIAGSWFTPLDNQQFDLVITNPPYVPEKDEHLFNGDVRFEPPDALRGGADGLDDIRRIVHAAPGHLEQGGQILLEHGFDQGGAVRNELRQCGFTGIETYADITGNPRVSRGLV